MLTPRGRTMSPPIHGERYWNEMVDRTINEDSPYARDHIYIGDHYDIGAPLLSPESMWLRHALIYGAPGFGKTVIETQLMTQFIARGHNVIVIDCKGSTAPLNNALKEIRRVARSESTDKHYTVRVFNPNRECPSHIYNPWRQRVWLDESPDARAESLLDAFGIRGEEGTDTAFFAAMAFLICADLNSWFPDARSSHEFLKLVNDRHLFVAKGGNPNDWNFSRHLAGGLRKLSNCGPVNAIPESAEQAIELTDLFESPNPQFIYLSLSAIDSEVLAGVIGRLFLHQTKRAAYRARHKKKRRKTFICCDEGQVLFGPMFANALEQLREFGVSLLMFHQCREQLITGSGDYRSRYENSVGVQVCLGARTQEEIEYISKTDKEVTEYALSWKQPQYGDEGHALLHPFLAEQSPFGLQPNLVNVSEMRVPRLGVNSIQRVSSDPHGGFIRGFLNDKLWAFDGSWIPFRWFHHVTEKQFRMFSNRYPKRLPGQQFFSEMPTTSAIAPNQFEGLTAHASADEVTKAIASLANELRRKNHPAN